MIKTDIEINYDSVKKAQAEIAILDDRLNDMIKSGEYTVDEVQAVMDKMNGLKNVVTENVTAILNYSNATAKDFGVAMESAGAKVTVLADQMDLSKRKIEEFSEKAEDAKNAAQKMIALRDTYESKLADIMSKREDAAQLVSLFADDAENAKLAAAELDEYSKQADNLQQKIAKLTKQIEQKNDASRDANMVVRDEKVKLSESTREHAKAQMQLDNTKRKYEQLAAAVRQSSDTVKEQTQAFQSMAFSLMSKAGLAGGFVGLINKVKSTRAQFQSMEVAMSTMLGADKAKGIMADLKQMATQSPLAMTDMVGAEKLMVSFGLDAKQSVKYIRALSDISGGDSGKFNSLALAFSQMSAAGKLMGQDLMQMINQGFNPLDEISRKTGKSIGVLKDEMSKGAISAKMVQDAFMSATQEGGKFFGMSENGAKTINGQMSMLGDAWDNAFNAIGEQTEGLIVGAIGLATDLVNSWQKLVPIILGVAAAFGVSKVAEIGAIAAEKALNAEKAKSAGLTVAQSTAESGHAALRGKSAIATGIATIAQNAYNTALAACPYVAVALGIAALVAVTVSAITHNNEFAEAQKKVADRLTQAAVETRKEQIELGRVVDKYRDAAKAVGELNKTEQEIDTNARKSTARLNEQAAAVGKATDKEKNKKKAVEETTDKTKENTEATEQNTEKQESDINTKEKAKQAEEELKTAKNELVAMAAKYGITLTDEQTKVENLAQSYAELERQIDKVNKAKAYTAIEEDANKQMASAMETGRQKLTERFSDKVLSDFSDLQGSREELKQVQDIMAGGQIAVQKVFDAIKQGTFEITADDLDNLTTDLVDFTTQELHQASRDALLDKIKSALGTETATSLNQFFNTIDEHSIVGATYGLREFADALREVQAAANMITTAKELGAADGFIDMLFSDAMAQATSENTKDLRTKKLSDTVKKIQAAEKQIQAIRKRIKSGQYSEKDVEDLKKYESEKSAAESEYKSLTGEGYKDYKNSSKKTKEAERSIEEQLYNLQKAEQNLHKAALERQLKDVQLLSEKKKIQEQILQIEKEQAMTDLQRQYKKAIEDIDKREDISASDKEKLKAKTRELYEGKEQDDGTRTIGLIAQKEAEFAQKERFMNLDYMQQEKEQMEGFIQSYGTYYEKRLAILEKYRKEKEKLLAAGFSEGSAEVEALKIKQEQESTNLAKSYTYNADEWSEQMEVEKEIQQLSDKAVAEGTEAMMKAVHAYIAEIDSELNGLDTEIENLKKAGKNVPFELEQRREQLQKKRNVAAQAEQDMEKDIVKNGGKHTKEIDKQQKKYQLLNKRIGLVKDTFDMLGEAAEGVAGEWASLVSTVAGSVMNVIGQMQSFTMAAIEAEKVGAESTAESIKTVEKASVILAVIGAVIQVATKVASMFSKGNDTTEQVSRYKEMASIYAEMSDKKREEVESSRTSEQARKATQEELDLIKKETDAYKKAIDARAEHREKREHSVGHKLQEQLKGQDWQNALQQENLTRVKGVRELLTLSGDELKRLRENHANMWATLDDEIKSSLESIISLEEQQEEAAQTLKDTYAGITLENLKDSGISLFDSMEKTASDFTDTLKTTLRDSIANAVIENEFAKDMADLQTQMAKANETSGVDPTEAAEIMRKGKELQERINARKLELAEEYGESSLFQSEDNNTVTTGTFAEMSEATANALEARFTAVYESNLRIEQAVTGNGNNLVGITTEMVQMINAQARETAQQQQETQRLLAESLLELKGINENGSNILKMLKTMSGDLYDVKNSTAKL